MNSAPILKIAFPKHLPLPEGETVLAADVGGTKTALALYEMRGGAMSLLRQTVYASNKFTSLEEAIRHFTGTSPLPARLSIAFAGPVQDGKAKATNLGWSIDIDALSRELGVSRVFLLNDLEAGAYGLAALNPQDFLTVYPGKTPATGNAAIIAPGTGLGEGGLYWDGSTFHPFATEGGHSAFAPVDAFDAELMLFLQSQYSRVSWERVVSGPGILRIYTFLRDIKKQEAPDWLEERMRTSDPAAAISLGAQEGTDICVETLRLFVRYLAVESSSLVLKLKATGGLFIGGGIPPKIWNDDLQAVFLEQFFDVGRLRPLLEMTPVYLVLNQHTALLGAAYYGFQA